MPRKPKPSPALPAADMREVAAAIKRLTKAGATFALCGANKVPLKGCPWGKRGSPVMRSAEEVIAHLKADPSHCIAVVLETVGLGLVDFDGAPVSEQARWVSDVFVKGAPPLCTLASVSGRHHLFYRFPPGASRMGKASGKWELPRLDGQPGDPDADDRDLQPLHGDLKLPGSTGFLPGTNVVRLAAAVLDSPEDAGVWDRELDDLMRAPRGDNLPAQLRRLRGSPKGAHNDTLNEVTFYAAPFRPGGVIEHALMAVACATGHAASRVRATIRSAYGGRLARLPGGTGRKRTSEGVGRLPGVRAGPTPAEPTTGRRTSDPADELINGGRTAAGVADALDRIGIEVGVLDDLGGALGMRSPGGTWQPCQSTDRHRIAGALRNRFRVEVWDRRTEERRLAPFALPPQELVEHLWEVAGGNRVNVMADFLAGCADITDRAEAYEILQGFAGDIWDLDPATEEIARVALPAVLIGAVGRHLEPGVKMDAMTVLAGPRGLGKSSFVRGLFPDAPEFAPKVVEGFSYGLRNRTDDDEQAGKLRGAALVEFTELSPHGVDLDRLKGFVDRRYDTYRPKYGTDAVPHPRTCVLLATANRPDPLPHDPTGHRKFWIVRLKGMSGECPEDEDTADYVTRYLDRTRRVLWGAAVTCWHGWREGMGAVHPCLSMPRRLWDTVTEIAEEGSAVEPVVQQLIDRIASLPGDITWLLPQEVAELTGRLRVQDGDYVAAPDSVLKQVRTALESVRPSWRRDRVMVSVDGGEARRHRVYVRPGAGVGGDLAWDREARRRQLGIAAPGTGTPAPATEAEARSRTWGVYPGGGDEE